ncbi:MULTISPECIES: hypothetical protein [Streptomyces]|nr:MULTISPECIES: hypothetical protein [Streptomyces]UIZ17242.1 hypothetical protein LZ559_35045 [Streptomyces sp. R527F]WST57570.1 hypothetical protein OG475_34000 [Streptomyces rubiginosohelvolus]WSU79141.1 hypothetical protein OG215_00150 [Streptomyces globisporus]
MTVDIRIIRAGQMYRYYLRETVVGDGRLPAWLRSRSATAFVHWFRQQLVISRLVDVHEKWFWLNFCGPVAERYR